MKRVLIFLFLGIFLMGFVFAANGEQARDTTGPMHDEVIATGGQGGTPEPQLMQERSENAIQSRMQIKTGEYRVEGRPIRIEQREANRIRLNAQSISADTELELEEETTGSQTKLKTKLSNGRNAEIKIMPDTASATALQRLRLKVCSEENNCTIELKEVGQGEEVRVAYELKAEKQSKILGLFRARMRLESQIDAETGDIIRERKPWWAFMAVEEDEEETEVEVENEVSEELLQEVLQE